MSYHFVCVAKYRRLLINEEVDRVFKELCLERSKRYKIRFLERGSEGDPVHFLIQSTPRYSPTQIVPKIKSITARELFSMPRFHNEVIESFAFSEASCAGDFYSRI